MPLCFSLFEKWAKVQVLHLVHCFQEYINNVYVNIYYICIFKIYTVICIVHVSCLQMLH